MKGLEAKEVQEQMCHGKSESFKAQYFYRETEGDCVIYNKTLRIAWRFLNTRPRRVNFPKTILTKCFT